MSLITVDFPLHVTWILGVLLLVIIWKLEKVKFEGKRFKVLMKFKNKSGLRT